METHQGLSKSNGSQRQERSRKGQHCRWCHPHLNLMEYMMISLFLLGLSTAVWVDSYLIMNITFASILLQLLGSNFISVCTLSLALVQALGSMVILSVFMGKVSSSWTLKDDSGLRLTDQDIREPWNQHKAWWGSWVGWGSPTGKRKARPWCTVSVIPNRRK